MCAFLLAGVAAAQQVPQELGQGWLPEFRLAARQILSLAEATPPQSSPGGLLTVFDPSAKSTCISRSGI